MRRLSRLSLVIVCVIATNIPAYSAEVFWDSDTESRQKKPATLEQLLALLNANEGLLETGELLIDSPYHNTLFPPEIAAPTFRWTDKDSGAKSWPGMRWMRNAFSRCPALVSHQEHHIIPEIACHNLA